MIESIRGGSRKELGSDAMMTSPIQKISNVGQKLELNERHPKKNERRRELVLSTRLGREESTRTDATLIA